MTIYNKIHNVFNKYDLFITKHYIIGAPLFSMALGMYFTLVIIGSMKLACPGTFEKIFGSEEITKNAEPIVEETIQPLTRFSLWNDKAEIFLYYGAPGRQPFIGGITYVDSNKDSNLDFIRFYKNAKLLTKKFNELSLEERAMFNYIEEKYDSLQKRYLDYFKK